MKKQLLNGEVLEFSNSSNDEILIWFNAGSRTFNLMLNGSLIRSTKTLTPIDNILNKLSNHL